MKAGLLISLLAAGSLTAAAQVTDRPVLSVVEGMMRVDLPLDLQSLGVKSNQAVVLTPLLVNGTDTLGLQPVAVYGRNRYLQWERGNRDGIPQTDLLFRAKKAPADYRYRQQIPYTEMLDGASLTLRIDRYGCAGCNDGAPVETSDLGLWRAPRLDALAVLTYVQPEVNPVKERKVSGRANVEYPVGQTVLLDDFRGNFAELAKVRATIDTVRGDKDITITSMAIKGFASPEGSYANNKRLAEGRTASLTRYVEQLYSFPRGFIKTSSTPEDWAGLEEWVEESNIDNRDAILAVIRNRSLDPDARDQRLRTQFPAQYQLLLNTVYPALRHSDYEVQYTVRRYSDPAEILAVMRTRPGNLDLDELHLAAQSLTPGSPEFNEVYEVAVRLYPDDPVANLNAASSALSRGDLDAAERYLAKAGTRPEAQLGRAVLAAERRDYDTALSLLQPLAQSGNRAAAALATQVAEMQQYSRAIAD